MYEEICDQLLCMYHQETRVYQCSLDYMNLDSRNDLDGEDFDEWRRTICKWSYDIVDHFGYDREIVFVSLNYLDRYLSNRLSRLLMHGNQETHTVHNGFQGSSKEGKLCAREFQLAGVTALYLALKIHGQVEETFEQERNNQMNFRRCSILSSSDFSKLSNGVYREKEIVEMEQILLKEMHYFLNPPTPVNFLVHFLQALDPDYDSCTCNNIIFGHCQADDYCRCRHRDKKAKSKKIKFVLYELARYFLELAVSVYDLSVRQRPSCVALASLVMAIDALDDDYVPPYFRKQYFIGLSEVMDPEHKVELEYVKVLIQDVCNEALSSSSQLSTHIYNILGNVHEKKFDDTRTTDSSPKSVSGVFRS